MIHFKTPQKFHVQVLRCKITVLDENKNYFLIYLREREREMQGQIIG